MSKRARVDRAMKKYFYPPNEIITLKDKEPKYKDLPVIVNIVATVKMLPDEKKYKFPLEDIAKVCNGMSQFAPTRFAADILRLDNSSTDTTALVFRSGKIVIVSGKTLEHVRYCIQVFRTIIEKVKCVMMEEDGRIVVDTLQGRTIFSGCNIHNIVGNGDLDQRIDLKALRDAAPKVISWNPDIFPGAKATVYLTDSRTCECSCKCNGGTKACDPELALQGKRCPKNKTKCRCTCRTLLFDSGCCVVTGGQSIADVNKVFFYIKQLAPKFVETGKEVPKHLRFAHRFGKILQDGFGKQLPPPKVKRRKQKGKNNTNKSDVDADEGHVMQEDEALAMVVMKGNTKDQMTSHKKIRYQGDYDTSVTPFMKACESGQYENVKTLLSIYPDAVKQTDSQGRTPLERILNIVRTERDLAQDYDDIISLLESHS